MITMTGKRLVWAPMQEDNFNKIFDCQSANVGSLIGECGLLGSLATLNWSAARVFFEAGQRRDPTVLQPLLREPVEPVVIWTNRTRKKCWCELQVEYSRPTIFAAQWSLCREVDP